MASSLLVRRNGRWREQHKSAGSGPPPPPPGWTPRFAGDPGPGKIWYGQSRSGGDIDGPGERISQYGGRRVGLFRAYGTPGEAVSSVVSKARDQSRKRRLCWLSAKVPNNEWAKVADGTQDAWLRSLVSGLAALGTPVWLCLHHEPWDEAGVTGGAANPVDNPTIPGNTAANHVAMHRRLRNMIAAEFPGALIAVVPILQQAPFTPSQTNNNPKDLLTRWYAVDSCDVIGLDSYVHWYINDPPDAKTWSKWREPPVAFEGIGLVASLGKPVAYAEYGIRTDWRNPGKSGQWMHDAYDYLIAQGVVGLSYFDSDKNVNDQLASDPYVGADGNRYGVTWDLSHGGRVDNQIPETPANGYPLGAERLNSYLELLDDPRTAYLPLTA